MPRYTNLKKEIKQPIPSMHRSTCKTDPTIVFSYTFTYALASMFTNTPSTHSSFQGIPTVSISHYGPAGNYTAGAEEKDAQFFSCNYVWALQSICIAQVINFLASFLMFGSCIAVTA
jgi:hypothetical protein